LEPQIIWSPWRSEYIKSFTKPHRERICLFCTLPKKEDKEGYIIYRGKRAYVVLNAFPYNSGHLMIVPYRHVSSLEYLDDDELFELVKLVKKSIAVLKEALKPDGINVGVNIGRAAGAGIEFHVHIHVVPRWAGDANFMPIIGNAKSLPVTLDETYRLLRTFWYKNKGL